MTVNSTPGNQSLGTNDASGGLPVAGSVDRPTHVPLHFIYAEKGTLEPVFCSGNDFGRIFGNKTLSKTFPGYNTGSEYLSLSFANANNSVVQRVLPDIDMVLANVTFCLELAPVTFTPNERRSDGTIVDGELLGEIPVEGYVHRIVTKVRSSYEMTALKAGASLSPAVGTWSPTGALLSAVSVIYPLFTVEASNYGGGYNDIGFSLQSSGMTKDEVREQNEMLYSLKRLDRINGNPSITKTSVGSDNITFGLSETITDILSELPIDLKEILGTMYEDVAGSLTFSDIGDIYVHDSNIATLRTKVNQAEIDALIAYPDEMTYDDGATGYLIEFSDYQEVDVEAFIATGDTTGLLTSSTLIDVLDMKYASRTPLLSINTHNLVAELADDLVDGYSLATYGGYTPSYMGGGELDYAILSKEELVSQYNNAVVEKMIPYASPTSERMSTALNIETNLYDPGFNLNTKLALGAFISQRTNTIINFQTDIVGEVLSDLDRVAIATAINNKMSLMAESTYFGTKVARYTISYGQGFKVDGSYRVPLGQNYELQSKCNVYMGASNGKWKTGKAFDRWPGNRVNTLKNLIPKEVPGALRSPIWDANCIFTDPYDMNQHFITASQTGYDDPTSILNGLLTIQAISYLQFVNDMVWREISGSQRLNNAQLKKLVEEKVIEKTVGVFDGAFVVSPICTVTVADQNRNYSWSLEVELYGAGMKTKQVSHITTRRIEELTEAQGA